MENLLIKEFYSIRFKDKRVHGQGQSFFEKYERNIKIPHFYDMRLKS